MRANKPAVMKYHISSLVSGGFRLSLALGLPVPVCNVDLVDHYCVEKISQTQPMLCFKTFSKLRFREKAVPCLFAIFECR